MRSQTHPGPQSRPLARKFLADVAGLSPILLALAALSLYVPGILLPALHVEKLGRSLDSSIFSGCQRLLLQGEIFYGLIVGLSAVVLPPLKLTALVWLGGLQSAGRQAPRWLFRAIEIIGPFSCLEVFLIAILVTMVRLNALVSFRTLPGLYFFTVSALLGIAASVVYRLGLFHRGEHR